MQDRECIDCQTTLEHARTKDVRFFFESEEKLATIDAWYCPKCDCIREVE